METCVVAYGGSIVIPTDSYDELAMTHLADILSEHSDKRFIIIIGGGRLCRNINSSVRSLLINANLSSLEIDVANDELGIATTKINARRVISSLSAYLGDDVVCPDYIDNPDIVPNTSHRIFIASGFKPGVTTDYCMMKLAQGFKASSAFKISNFPMILNVKPLNFNKVLIDSYDALPSISWDGIVDLVGDEFIPGGNYPLDPPAAKLGLKLSNLNSDFTLFVGQKDQFESMLSGEEFIGTVIRND